jgi:hypothetical protein
MTGRAPSGQRVIPCRDAVGRARSVIVLADEGRAVLVAPPGEVAVLSAAQTRQVAAALLDMVAERDEGSGLAND